MAKKIRNVITIVLTDEQVKELNPLFEKVKSDFYAGNPGSILGQVEWNYITEKGTVTAKFADNKLTKKIRIATGVEK